MSADTYRVAQGVIRRPRDPKSPRKIFTSSDFIKQGEIVPDGVLSPEEVANLLASGIIEPATVTVSEKPAVLAKRGRWSVDPASLIGKSLEDLLIMVQEVDPAFDAASLTTLQEAVIQLTADWDPAFRDVVAHATDRSRPEQLGTTGTKNLGDLPMSDAAAKVLASAKAKAAQE